MSAYYTCVNCRMRNACNCNNCLVRQTDYKRLITDDLEDGQFKCAYCDEIISFDMSEDLGWRVFDMTRTPEYFHSLELKLFHEENLPHGNILPESKSEYKNKYPTHTVYYNVNAETIEDGNVWHGDIDLTLYEENLKRIAKAIDKDIYLTYDGISNAFYTIKK